MAEHVVAKLRILLFELNDAYFELTHRKRRRATIPRTTYDSQIKIRICSIVAPFLEGRTKTDNQANFTIRSSYSWSQGTGKPLCPFSPFAAFPVLSSFDIHQPPSSGLDAEMFMHTVIMTRWMAAE